MPTRGRFVCHVHCLVHDGAVWSSPCRPHHENFGRNLYHMFVPAYLASESFVLFWVVVFELLQSQMLIPYLSQAVFSYSYVNTNPSWSSSLPSQFLLNPCVSLQVDPIFFNIRKINSSLLNGLRFIRTKCLCFSHPPTIVFLEGFRFLDQVSILFLWSLLILFFECSTRWFTWRCSSSSSFLTHFSSPVVSSQALLIISFPHFKAFSCRCNS